VAASQALHEKEAAIEVASAKTAEAQQHAASAEAACEAAVARATRAEVTAREVCAENEMLDQALERALNELDELAQACAALHARAAVLGDDLRQVKVAHARVAAASDDERQANDKQEGASLLAGSATTGVVQPTATGTEALAHEQ